MIWKYDCTDRFPRRLYWEFAEIDELCEQRTLPFFEARYGQAPARISTDALTVLIDDEAEVLDLEADLIADNELEEIYGVTTFCAEERPIVETNRHLRRRFWRINPAHDTCPRGWASTVKIWCGWTPKRAASSGTVDCSRKAASATLALKAGSCLRRLADIFCVLTRHWRAF